MLIKIILNEKEDDSFVKGEKGHGSNSILSLSPSPPTIIFNNVTNIQKEG